MNTNEFARTLLLGIKNLLSWIGIPRHLLDKLDEILFLVCIVTIAFVVAAVVHLLLVRAARKISNANTSISSIRCSGTASSANRRRSFRP